MRYFMFALLVCLTVKATAQTDRVKVTERYTSVTETGSITPNSFDELFESNSTENIVTLLTSASNYLTPVTKTLKNSSNFTWAINAGAGVTLDGATGVGVVVLKPKEYITIQSFLFNNWKIIRRGTTSPTTSNTFTHSVTAPGTTSVSIPHSLGSVPASYTVYPENQNAAGISWYEATSTAIVLHYSTAPAGLINYRVSITK